MCIHLVTVSRAATFSRMIAARKDAMLPRMKSGLDYRSESSMTIAGCIVHYRHANPNPDSHITMRVRIGVHMSERIYTFFESKYIGIFKDINFLKPDYELPQIYWV